MAPLFKTTLQQLSFPIQKLGEVHPANPDEHSLFHGTKLPWPPQRKSRQEPAG
jgi:hypothetical protein